METELYVKDKLYDIAYLGGENPLPFFSDEVQDLKVPVDESMNEEDIRYLGWDNGRKVLPYRMQDRYTRKMSRRKLKTVILENDHLRVEVLPQLGARVHSLYDKKEERELLFRNPYIRFGNLALRNAWFAGGIEWNIGQLGHSYFTCSSVYVARIHSWEDSVGIRIYEYERRKGLFWQVDLHLPMESRYLFCHIRIENTTGRELPMYWWTNIALPERKSTRVIAPAEEVIYMRSSTSGKRREKNYYDSYGYGKSRLPYIPSLDGKDATYPSNYDFSSEIYYQCQGVEMPWGAAIEGDGRGFIEISTKNFPVRKMFCFGMHQGGRHWKEFLSREGEAYIELQAGFGKTQQHSVPMKRGDVWEWTELFGSIKTDPKIAHSNDWGEVVHGVTNSLESTIKPTVLRSFNEQLSRYALFKPVEILHVGSGWGALEIERCKREGVVGRVPVSLNFPEDSMGKDEKPWLELLKSGILPRKNTNEVPDSWMVQSEWLPLLEKSLERERNWYSLLHYGVMLMENGDKVGARKVWEESIRLEASCWVFRNLGQLALRDNNTLLARTYLGKAWEKAVEDGILEPGIAEEYLEILNRCGMYDESLTVYENLPEEIKRLDRVRIVRARIAYEKDDFNTLEEILKGEFACIREGETELTDLWFGMWEKKLSARLGGIVTEAIREEVRRKYPPPKNIDFRKVSDIDRSMVREDYE